MLKARAKPNGFHSYPLAIAKDISGIKILTSICWSEGDEYVSSLVYTSGMISAVAISSMLESS